MIGGSTRGGSARVANPRERGKSRAPARTIPPWHDRARLGCLALALSLAGCFQSSLGRDDARVDTDSNAAADASLDHGAITPDAIAPADGAVITAPDEQWTWIPMDGVTCGDGSPSGIGVNLTHRSNNLLVLIQGGGACWDVNTCFVIHAASHIDTPYGANEFQSDVAGGQNVLVFDRTSNDNPFRDANYVFVPYCTGDVHSGDRVVTYSAAGQTRDVHHVGARNMQAILARLGATFRSASRVWWTGFSAGGYGAILNWERAQNAFPNARVDLMSDCGDPIMPVNHWGEWVSTWSMQLPAGCTECATNLTAVVDHGFARMPTSRFAWLAYQQDAVISAFYGISGSQLQAAITTMQPHVDMQNNWRDFVLPGTTHVMLGDARTLAAGDGQTLRGFLGAWASDDPAWHSSHP